MGRPIQLGGFLAAMSVVGAGAFCTSSPSTDPAKMVTGTGGQLVSPKPIKAAERPPREPAMGAAGAAGAPGAARVTAGLGADIVRSLGGPVAAEVAWLRVVAASEAERHVLGAPDRIAGYPVVGPLRPIASPDTTRLLEMLVRDESYDFDLRLRCVNKRLLGVRFLASSPVEFALGMPCNQAIWAFRRAGTAERWGAIMSDTAAASFRSLLGAAGSLR